MINKGSLTSQQKGSINLLALTPEQHSQLLFSLNYSISCPMLASSITEISQEILDNRFKGYFTTNQKDIKGKSILSQNITTNSINKTDRMSYNKKQIKETQNLEKTIKEKKNNKKAFFKQQQKENDTILHNLFLKKTMTESIVFNMEEPEEKTVRFNISDKRNRNLKEEMVKGTIFNKVMTTKSIYYEENEQISGELLKKKIKEIRKKMAYIKKELSFIEKVEMNLERKDTKRNTIF